MFGRVAALLALAITLAAHPPHVASADQGCTLRTGRPGCTVLRPVQSSERGSLPGDAPECIVLVGGLGSPVGRDDGFFDPVLAGLEYTAEGRSLVRWRFGLARGDLHPYDTYGAISPNAESLRSLVADLSDECFAIHVVAHSMGGAVVDRAFSLGMDPAVVTYLPLSSPHNGATAARALRVPIELDDTFAAYASGLATATGGHDPGSPAVRDLAHITAPRPPRGVETIRQRTVSDLFVLRRDGRDRRVEGREYLPAGWERLEGHGGIAHDPHVARVVAAAIGDRRIPSDERPPSELRAAALVGCVVDDVGARSEGAIALLLASLALRLAADTAAAELPGRLWASAPDIAAIAGPALDASDAIASMLSCLAVDGSD